MHRLRHSFPKLIVSLLSVSGLIACSAQPSADALSDIQQYRVYTENFASSGQPTTEQLTSAAKAGVERVIYLAFTDSHGAIANEDSIVTGLGMRYVHIPVVFKNPTLSDFQRFTAEMKQSQETNTLVHCQVNLRASSFSFLYRVIFLDVPMLEAKNSMDSVWTPNEVWYKFIRSVLSEYGRDINCEGCDWGVNEFTEK